MQWDPTYFHSPKEAFHWRGQRWRRRQLLTLIRISAPCACRRWRSGDLMERFLLTSNNGWRKTRHTLRTGCCRERILPRLHGFDNSWTSYSSRCSRDIPLSLWLDDMSTSIPACILRIRINLARLWAVKIQRWDAPCFILNPPISPIPLLSRLIDCSMYGLIHTDLRKSRALLPLHSKLTFTESGMSLRMTSL
jgi:hypothetical protein